MMERMKKNLNSPMMKRMKRNESKYDFFFCKGKFMAEDHQEERELPKLKSSYSSSIQNE